MLTEGETFLTSKASVVLNIVGGTFGVGLVDDHPIVREGLGNLVKKIPQARLRFSYDTPEEALAHLEREALDILLLDLSLAGSDGLIWLKRFRSCFPDLKILMLTVSDDEADLSSAIRFGACGYLLKDSECEQILAAIECARLDIATVSPAALLPALFRRGSTDRSLPEVKEIRTLTQREKQILTLVAGGNSNKEIGRQLQLAETTVKKYSYNAMTKLASHNRESAAMVALRLGLIEMANIHADA